MGLARQTSAASSGGLSDNSHVSDLSGQYERDQQHGAEAHGIVTDDVLATAPRAETAVFYGMYSFQQARLDAKTWVVVYRLALDYLQLLLVVLQPSFGWHINTDLWIWKVANWAGHISSRLVLQGRGVYTVAVLLTAASLVLCLLLCVWTAWSLQNSAFLKHQWPVKILRVFLVMVVHTFYVSLLEMFLVSDDCRFFGALPDGQRHGTLAAWPSTRCLAMPYLIYFALGLFLSVLMLSLDVLVTVGEVERDLCSHRLLAALHVSVELKTLLTKTLLVAIASTLESYARLQAALLAALALYLVWVFLSGAPHLNQWVNHTRVGLYASAVMPCLLLVPLSFMPGSAGTLTLVLWVSICAAAPTGFLASFCVTRWRLGAIRAAISRAPSGAKPELVCKFGRAEEVEFAVRVARRWVKDDVDTLDEDAVREAEDIIKLGLAQLGSDPTMLLLYSTFLISVTDTYQTGYAQALAAKKQEPNFVQRFTIFVREHDHRSAASGRGMGGAMDLVAYIEFQRSLKSAMHAHKSALFMVRAFWRMTLHSTASFRHLVRATAEIRRAREHADKVYRSLLENYPKSAKLVRCYARFQEDVQNDPWAASRYFRQAEKLDVEHQEGQMGLMQFAGADGGFGGGANDQTSAIMVVDGGGMIQMVNKVTSSLFGWSKNELEGKNVAVLVPAPYSVAAHLAGLEAQGKDVSVKARKPAHTLEVAGLHKQRHMFPILATLTKVNGSGDEATLSIVIQAGSTSSFIRGSRWALKTAFGWRGLLRESGVRIRRCCRTVPRLADKAIPQEAGVVTVWALPSGAIASVDANFGDAFGSTPDEWVGRDVASMAVDRAALQTLVMAAAAIASNNADEASRMRAYLRSNSALPLPDASKALSRVNSAFPLMDGMGGEEQLVRRVGSSTAGISGGGLYQQQQQPAAAILGAVPVDAAKKPVVASAHNVQLLHQHCDPVTMDVTVCLGGAASSPVLVFAFRRSTADSGMKMALDHRGRMVYVSSALAAAVGHTPATLVAARRTLDALLPQPWAQLHAACWQNRHPASGSSGGGAVVAGYHYGGGSVGAGGGDVSAAWDVVAANAKAGAEAPAEMPVNLLTADNGLVPVVMAATVKEGRGEHPTHLVAVTHSSVAAGLDFRRLKLEVDLTGVVLSVGDSPSSMFGFSPEVLVGRNLCEFVDVLRLAVLSGGTNNKAASHAPSAVRKGASLHQPDEVRPAGKSANLPATATDASDGSSVGDCDSDAGLMDALLPPPRRGGGGDSVCEEEDEDLGGDGYFQQLLEAGASVAGWHKRAFSLSQLLELLVDRSSSQPGISWRVGVHAPTDLERIRGLSLVASKMLTKQTRAAVLQVASAEHALSESPHVTMHLWRADWLSGVVEVDVRHETIARVTDPKWHPPGLLLGMPFQSLQRVPVSQLLNERTSVLLSLDGGRRGGIKVSGRTNVARVGPLRNVTTRHLDGQELQLGVQAVAKQGTSRHVFLVLRLAQPQLGDVDAFLWQLLSSSATSKWVALKRPGLRPAAQAARAAPRGGPTKPSAVATAAGGGVKFASSAHDADSLLAEALMSSSPRLRAALERPAAAAAAAAGPPRSPTAGLAHPLSRMSVDSWAGRHDVEDDDGGGGPGAVKGGRGSMDGRIGQWVMGEADASRHLAGGGGGEVGGSEDGDDDRSEASDGDASVMGKGAANDDALSEASAGNASSHASMDDGSNVDYQRGRRFQKLTKLVSRGPAQAAAQRFKWHSTAAWLVLIVGIVACYLTLTMLLAKQTTNLDNMTATSFADKFVSQIATDTRVIEVILRGVPNVLYGPQSLQKFVTMLDKCVPRPRGGGVAAACGAIRDLMAAHTGVYLGFSDLTPLTHDFGLWDLWNNAGTTTYALQDLQPARRVEVNMTLWADGNQYMASAREILNNYAVWKAANVSLASTRDFYYISNNYLTFFNGYTVTMDATVNIALLNCDGVNNVQLMLMVAYGCVLCTLVLLYACWLAHSAAEQRYRLFSVFLAVPQGFLRAQATKQVRLEDDSDDESGSDSGDVAADTDDSKSFTVAGGGFDEGAAPPQGHVFSGAWDAFVGFLFFWRPMHVGAKRRLLRNGRDSYWLVTPYFVWLVIAILTYALGYQMLVSMQESLQMLNLIAQARIRYRKAVHQAHEACAVTDPAAKARNLAVLAADLALNRNRWVAMLYGAKAAGLQDDPLYRKVQKGLPFYAQADSDILYKTDTCLRPAGTACPPVTSPYYQITRSGLDAMVQRFFNEAELLTLDNLTNVHLNNSRLNYLWEIGNTDIIQAWLTLSYNVLDTAQGYFRSVDNMGLIVLVVCLILALAYVVLCSLPFMRLVSREAREVAELLSHLPKNVGVEYIVRREMQLIERPPGGAGAAAARTAEETRPILTAPSLEEAEFLRLASKGAGGKGDKGGSSGGGKDGGGGGGGGKGGVSLARQLTKDAVGFLQLPPRIAGGVRVVPVSPPAVAAPPPAAAPLSPPLSPPLPPSRQGSLVPLLKVTSMQDSAFSNGYNGGSGGGSSGNGGGGGVEMRRQALGNASGSR